MAGEMRQTARAIFAHALESSSVDAAFARHVEYTRGVLRIRDDLHELASYPRTLVVAFGKAGHTMAEALAQQVGTLVEGIIAAPAEAVHGKPQLPGYRYFAGGHPTPNGESVKAADAILKSLSTLPERSLVIYLISGGGSAIVEKPTDKDISLADLIATYQVLVHSGAPIAEINAIRKHLSAVKGGRMARVAAQRNVQQVSIMVSDVPEGALDALASGPTMPDPSSVEDCYRIAAAHGMTEQFPASVRDLFTMKALEETPDKDDPLFHRSRWWPILSNETALRAAAGHAAELGFEVVMDSSCDDWDYTRSADYLLDRVRQLQRHSSRVCVVSGGEVTVRVGESGGTGGRNQQFVLYCAGKIAGEKITVLSGGTDGTDGNSPAAGAVADGQTLARWSARGEGHSLNQMLQRFDAYTFFAELDDAIVTGPTGTNVRDLRILLAE